jgi:hypothetical protein
MKTRTGRLQCAAVAGIALSLVACAAIGPTAAVDDFGHKATRWDIELYWNCVRPEPGLLQVDGVAISTYI